MSEEQLLERLEQQREWAPQYDICGLCGKREPVDRNGEFLYPCPRAGAGNGGRKQ